ncbi:MAG TPA: AAA family ATPase [Polyangiaceae bacterium]
MTADDVDEEAFVDLLRRVARTPEVAAVRRDVDPGTELVDRFVIERKLGEGAMGRVFSAFDRTRQTNVAIKMLGILTPRSMVSIKQEFRVASELIHPNLVRLHELFSDGAEWFFTMDLLAGTTLDKLRAAHGGLEHALIYDLFRQLALGLSELHGSGTLHGDLKPSNFMIVGDERRVVLLDFGLARPLRAVDQDNVPAGTPEYMAPEQAAGKRVTEAADWYSFGVVLFEALTGKLPWLKEVAAELAAVPAPLAQLCLELLSADPQARPRGESILRVLGGESPQRRVSTQAPAERPNLVGRSAESARLRAAYERLDSGSPQIVFVRGDSGIGKTALVEELVSEVTRRGAIVLAGRCRERESVSYKAVDGLIDGLVKCLDQLPRQVAAGLLPEGISDLTRLFPTLRAAAAIAHSPKRSLDISDQSIVKKQAVAAFRDLLAALCERAPLVIWIDDLQWSDVHSAVLLEPLLTGPKPVPLLFVGSYRTAGGQRGATIEALYGASARGALPDPTVINLAPLSDGDAEALARDLLGLPEPEASVAAREIAREAGGHPLFIAELVHSRGTAEGASHADEPHTLGEIVRQRVRALPRDAQGLLEATAVASVPLSRAVARRTRSLTANQTERALDVLRVNRLARTHDAGDESLIDVHHDRIREIVVQSLSDDSRREHHRALGRALEAEPRVNPEVLATHFHAAGESAQAGHYWIAAGHAAFEALAFGHAAELYQRGAQFAQLDAGALGALQVRQAEALAYAGQGAAAADQYLVAAESHPRDTAIELRRRAAEQLLLAGHLERGLGVIGLVLSALKMRATRTGFRVLFSILLGRLLVRLRGLRFRLKKEADISQKELARVDASWSIACSLGVVDFMRGADFQNDHLLLALRAGEPRRLLRAFTLEISYASTPGLGAERRTRALLNLSQELVRRVDDPAAAALVRVSRGVAAYLNGRFAEAIVECQAGVSTLSRYSGTVWETVTAQRFVIASLFHLGRLATLTALVPPLLAEAEARGNLYASTYFRTSYSNSAWLARNRVDEAREQLRTARAEWTAPGVQLPHGWMLVGEAHLALYTGETEPFWAHFLRQWRSFAAAQFLRIGILRVQLWHLRGMSALAEAHALKRRGRPSDARQLFLEAERAAHKLAREPLALTKPLGGLLLSAVEYENGARERARTRLGHCVSEFERQDMRLYAAAARTRLGEILGGDEGAELIRDARGALGSEGVVSCDAMVNVLSPAFG